MLTAASSPYNLRDTDLLFGEAVTPYTLRVKDLPDEERPRERLLHNGVASLSSAELVAILWGVGTRKEDVLAMAKRTLREYGEKGVVSERNPRKLALTAGIPLTKACQLIAGFELGKRFYATGRGGRPAQVRDAKQAYHYLRDMGAASKEQLRGLYLDSRYQLVHDEIISVGSLTSNVVHPREVFQPAIERGAVAVIVAHNHPSGSTEPTNADIAVTEQLLAAGKILGIDLLDHLIITNEGHTSLMEYLS